MEVPRLGVKLKLQMQAYTTATGNTRSELCLKPTPQFMAMQDPYPTEQGQGFELASSWILVRFVSAVPQQELPGYLFLMRSESSLYILHTALCQV